MGKIGNTRSEPRPNTICLEGNGSRPSHNGDGWHESEKMYTLNTTEVHSVAYAIGSYHSNAWKSSNPNSGIYKTEIAKTLDNVNCGNPSCNQGGTCVISYGLEPGAAKRLDPENRIWQEAAPTLRANAGDNQASVAVCNFKADGAVGGGKSFAIVGDHENRPTDMTNLVVMGFDSYNQSLSDVMPSLRSAEGGDSKPMVLAIHKASGQDVTVQNEKAYALVTSGGKPGQGYPCVMITNDERTDSVGIKSEPRNDY